MNPNEKKAQSALWALARTMCEVPESVGSRQNMLAVKAVEADAAFTAIRPYLLTPEDERVLEAAKAYRRENPHAANSYGSGFCALAQAVDAHPRLTPPKPPAPKWEVRNDDGIMYIRRNGKDLLYLGGSSEFTMCEAKAMMHALATSRGERAE